MIRCSAQLVVWEMPIKTTMRYHFPFRLTIKKKRERECKSVGEDVDKLEPSYFVRECIVVPPLWKTVCSFLKKLIMNLPYYLAIPLLVICPREMKTCLHTHTQIHTQIFIAALFIIAKRWKQLRCPPTDECTHKQNVVYPFSGIFCTTIQRTDILIHPTIWVDLESIMQSDRSETEKITVYYSIY